MAEPKYMQYKANQKSYPCTCSLTAKFYCESLGFSFFFFGEGIHKITEQLGLEGTLKNIHSSNRTIGCRAAIRSTCSGSHSEIGAFGSKVLAIKRLLQVSTETDLLHASWVQEI